jgi:hypothetical protein
MLITAAVAICGIAFASTGISQTKTTTTKKTTTVPTGTKASSKKVDVTQKETNEQRLRRLKNEQTEKDCLELLKKGSGGSVEYNESKCTIRIRKGGQYLNVYLEKANVSVRADRVVATCRSSNTGQCVSEDGPDVNKNVASIKMFFQNDEVAKANQCFKFLHEKCKDM